MATHTLTKDRSTTWTVTDNSSTWTTNKGADIFTVGKPGIFEAAGKHDNKIVVNGNIDSYGSEIGAIQTIGKYTDITIAKGAALNGTFGIKAADDSFVNMATGLDIVNHGTITAAYYGIVAGKDGTVFNDGRISGLIGIHGSGSKTSFTNAEGGHVNTGQYGFISDATVSTKLVNHGVLASASNAVYDSDSVMTMINDGTVVGAVSLGGGNDKLDSRSGIIKGAIYGGDGDDTFIIGRSDFVIIESTGMTSGNDTVKSSADYTLADNIEKLYLFGSNNVDGEGNALANRLAGNSGNNNLYGFAGDDMISGGKGNDRLVGGLGMDTFVFNKGNKVDKIVDFENGVDKIQLHGFSGVTDFAALGAKMSQQDGDAQIEFGSGDILIVKATLTADLDATDFLFV